MSVTDNSATLIGPTGAEQIDWLLAHSPFSEHMSTLSHEQRRRLFQGRTAGSSDAIFAYSRSPGVSHRRHLYIYILCVSVHRASDFTLFYAIRFIAILSMFYYIFISLLSRLFQVSFTLRRRSFLIHAKLLFGKVKNYLYTPVSVSRCVSNSCETEIEYSSSSRFLMTHIEHRRVSIYKTCISTSKRESIFNTASSKR